MILIQQARSDAWLMFRNPVAVHSAATAAEVLPVLEKVRQAASDGYHAAGFLAYEAAPGMDPAFETHRLSGLPLVWMGIFREPESCAPPSEAREEAASLGPWQPSLSEDAYRAAIKRIKAHLKAGNSYQVNYTFRLRSAFSGSPLALFAQICRRQHAGCAAFIETDAFALCSASPELFLRLDGTELVSRPMKGTSRRGMTAEEDKLLAARLRASEKNRAENVMIVDMIRNDMGRIADPGTVHVPHLFTVETYPTVLQMTSTVACRTSATFPDIMKALFPCASITGAPKVRTMQIIRELEPEPRGIYTGCIGYLAPARKAVFNVAIRTVHVDKSRGHAEYGVGGGIVWDSDAGEEYEECRTKADVLAPTPPSFELLESLLWDGYAYFLLESHLARLLRSAAYFDFELDISHVRGHLMQIARDPALQGQPHKVRLTATRQGQLDAQASALADQPLPRPFRVALAREPVQRRDPFLYHKTTYRAVYDQRRAGCANVDDVILWNENGEITESTIANVVVERKGAHVTPPVSCGLLAGVFREALLAQHSITEDVITVDEFRRSGSVSLINSVRKWIPARLVR